MKEYPILEVKNLTIQYENENGTIIANRAVSMELYQDEITGIVGYNASGKSTLLKAIMGLLLKEASIEEGKILYKDKDITEYKDKDFFAYQDMMKEIRGKEIAMIFQNPTSYFDPTMKISKQIYEALPKDIPFLKRKAHALDLLNEFHVQDASKVLKSYPMELSGGTLQKIMIALALMHRPNVLLCDEPFSALDEISTQEMIDIIKKYKAETKMSVIFVSHDIELVKELCDNAYMMKDGVISACYEVPLMFEQPTDEDVINYIAMKEE